MPPAVSGAGLRYAGAGEFATLAADAAGSLLGCIGFGCIESDRIESGAAGSDATESVPAGLPFARVDMPVVGADRLYELWFAAAPVQRERRAGLQLAHDGQVLFGCVAIPPESGLEYDALIHREYCAIFDALDALGYPNLIRAWHYLPDIHLDEDRLERYKRFSLGRHEAFVARGRAISRDAPAASAVGKRPGDTVICFLAARRPGTPIENPRQVSAWSYPVQYGPRGPTFSRALFTAWGEVPQLYISGTASIFGHASLHPGDPRSQAAETLLNLESVIREARDQGLLAVGATTETLVKTYLRRPELREQVEPRLRAAFGAQAQLVWLQADICRSELLLEVEVVCANRVPN